MKKWIAGIAGVAVLGTCFLYQNCGMAGFKALPSSADFDSTAELPGGADLPGPVIPATGISALLNWDLPSTSQASGFLIESSTDGLNYTSRGQVAGNLRSYKASGLEKGRTYTFRIRSQNAIGSSEPIIQQIQVPAH